MSVGSAPPCIIFILFLCVEGTLEVNTLIDGALIPSQSLLCCSTYLFFFFSKVFQFGIWRYTLETYSAVGIMTFRHKNFHKHTSSVLDIYINTTEAIVMLKFKTIKGQPFLLCEFMLYGGKHQFVHF